MQDETRKNDEVLSVPYVVYESAQTRMERTIKRLVIALIVAIALTFATNLAWLYYWNQYDYTTTEVDVDAKDGIANYIGNDGDINKGTDFSENIQKATKSK